MARKLKVEKLMWFACLFILAGFGTMSGLDIAAFQDERLEYDLFYKGILSASSNMWVEADDSTIHLIWTVQSKPFVKILFNLNNRYEIITDAEGRLLQSNKFIEQKNIQQQWSITYDWQNKLATNNQEFNWPVIDGCHTVLSMLYDLRRRSLSTGDSIGYYLDIESQIWCISGSVDLINKDAAISTGHEIVFYFSPAMEIKKRAWKTDLLTNRLARDNSPLAIQLGPPPRQLPQLIRFGGDVEMRLKQ